MPDNRECMRCCKPAQAKVLIQASASDGDHFKIFLACAALRTGPVHRHVFPARARGDALFRQAGFLVINPAADQAHPGLEFLSGCLVVTHGTALKVKCTAGYLNAFPVQNQTSPLVLTFGIADPVGAIGIQADLAAFAAMGCHGLSVLTAVSIGDTTGTEDLQTIDPEWVSDQARTLLEDMPVAALKVGYVGNIETISVIAEIVSDYPEIPLVLDPFATTLPEQDVDEELLLALRELLVPQTTLLQVSASRDSSSADTCSKVV